METRQGKDGSKEPKGEEDKKAKQEQVGEAEQEQVGKENRKGKEQDDRLQRWQDGVHAQVENTEIIESALNKAGSRKVQVQVPEQGQEDLTRSPSQHRQDRRENAEAKRLREVNVSEGECLRWVWGPWGFQGSGEARGAPCRGGVLGPLVSRRAVGGPRAGGASPPSLWWVVIIVGGVGWMGNWFLQQQR